MGLSSMIKRNSILFFKDKGMFFTSLITPLILLVLYATFLADVFRNSFLLSFPTGMEPEETVINALVGGQLFSSLLAVSCVTVSFCSNMLMVQDRANGTVKDLFVTPLRPSVLAMSYYISTMLTTLAICLVASGACFLYLAVSGWLMSLTDVLLILLDVFLIVLFGTALSSVINFFLSSQGQISAVGTIVSSGYGFICGAYMPISQFGEGLQTVISFLPGTYATSLLRNHAMRGALAELENMGYPQTVIESIRDGVDCNLYFFGSRVEEWAMYLVLVATILLLVGVYVALNRYCKKHRA
ncbi:MAG: ABC transporter permease [Clostridia bacterium]|nr:ABC transporter permease [Clostridia bacterium]